MTAPVITVTPAFEGRRATARIGGERTFLRTFWATSNVAVDSQIIGNSPDVPRLGGIYLTTDGGFDIRATCREVRITQRDESHREWKVEAEYSTAIEGSLLGGGAETGAAPSQAGQENPLLRAPSIRWGTNRYSQPADKTAAGGAILNSAGDPFDPPVTKDLRNLTLNVNRNVPEFDPVLIAVYAEAVNSTRWLRFGPRQAKCTSLGAEWKYENGVYFWTISAQFEFKKGTETWDKAVLDRGFRQLVTNIDGTQEVTAAEVVGGGAGYQVGDTLTVAGGTSTVDAVLRVTEVVRPPGLGAITGVVILEPGAATFEPTGAVSPTTASPFTFGTGATFLVTWDGAAASAVTINTAGTGYKVNDQITLEVPGLTPVVLQVNDIDTDPYAKGPIAAVGVQGSGVYSVIPTNPVTPPVTSGTGTGASIDLVFQFGKSKQAIFVGGQRPTQPVLLDGDGLRLADGGAPVFLVFDLDGEADFNALGLV